MLQSLLLVMKHIGNFLRYERLTSKNILSSLRLASTWDFIKLCVSDIFLLSLSILLRLCSFYLISASISLTIWMAALRYVRTLWLRCLSFRMHSAQISIFRQSKQKYWTGYLCSGQMFFGFGGVGGIACWATVTCFFSIFYRQVMVSRSKMVLAPQISHENTELLLPFLQ